MLVKTESLVSITESNQNFSKAARLVDENGSAVIKKTMFKDTSLWNSRLPKKFKMLPTRTLQAFQKD